MRQIIARAHCQVHQKFRFRDPDHYLNLGLPFPQFLEVREIFLLAMINLRYFLFPLWNQTEMMYVDDLDRRFGFDNVPKITDTKRILKNLSTLMDDP